MAQESADVRTASGIARVGKRAWGYDTTQVDDFLDHAHELYEGEGAQLAQEDIQDVSFDLSRGGYSIGQVDAALARLERAVVDKRTAWEIAEHGRVAWKARTEELYGEISKHAGRESRQRFRPGEPKHPSYDRKQVDRLVDQVVAKARAGLSTDSSDGRADALVDFNAGTVSNVIFTQRKGRKGYDERQVDFYLNACVRLLSRMESYLRVADYAVPMHDDCDDGRTVGQEGTDGAADSLFASFGQGADAGSGAGLPASFAPAEQSFDALHEAERSIFAVPRQDSVPSDAVSDVPASPVDVSTPNAQGDANRQPLADVDAGDAAVGFGGFSDTRPEPVGDTSLASLASLNGAASPSSDSGDGDGGFLGDGVGATTAAMGLPPFDEAPARDWQERPRDAEPVDARPVSDGVNSHAGGVASTDSPVTVSPRPAVPTVDVQAMAETSVSFDIPDLSFPTFTPQVLPESIREPEETRDGSDDEGMRG